MHSQQKLAGVIVFVRVRTGDDDVIFMTFWLTVCTVVALAVVDE